MVKKIVAYFSENASSLAVPKLRNMKPQICRKNEKLMVLQSQVGYFLVELSPIMHLCMCACVCLSVCVFVCVRERVSERERERGGEHECCVNDQSLFTHLG